MNFTQNQYTFTEGQNGSICVEGNGRSDKSFKVDIQVVNEGDSVELTVTKLGESSIPVSVLLFTADVTTEG